MLSRLALIKAGMNQGKDESNESSMDDMMAGAVLVWMYEQNGEERYAKACHHIYHSFSDYPRTREGGFLHNRFVYPGEMWVDGVFMGQMFYARYGRAFQKPECFDFSRSP